MSGDYSRYKEVSRPEDDRPDKVLETIAILERTQMPAIMQIANEQQFDLNQPNTSMRVMSFCHGQNEYQWFLLNLGIDISHERLDECIQQMRSLGKRDPTELLKTELLAHELGLEYRRIRLSLGL